MLWCNEVILVSIDFSTAMEERERNRLNQQKAKKNVE